mgnify:CR=1 FL=1
MILQPFVHDLCVTLQAPTQVWSSPSGDIDLAHPIHGVHVGDTRVLSGVTLEVTCDGQPVELAAIAKSIPGGADASFVSVVRVPSDLADPMLTMTRRRHTDGTGISETMLFESAFDEPRRLQITLSFTPDASPLPLIKGGYERSAELAVTGQGWSWGPASATLSIDGADVELVDGKVRATWDVELAPQSSHTVGWQLQVSDDSVPFVGYSGQPLQAPASSGQPALDRLITRAVRDLNGLRLGERADATRGFIAAGTPWFLTLFGRDSLITARLALALDPQLAISTLQVLAGYQGTKVDIDTAEQPGKILHEVRAQPFDVLDQAAILPPLYYGTIDATLLWIILLGQCWQAGVPGEQIGQLMDPLRNALGWLRDYADADGDGFLEYIDESGHGLANQGWKDSADSIRFADGQIAEGPIALCEVQGYAYHAAVLGAQLLDEFGDEADAEQADYWRSYAAELADRFRAKFWVEDDQGRYPAIALDGAKRPVDGVASNMGHLLVTGIVNDEEAAIIVKRLMDPTMFSGYGVRTMSTDNGRYWPTRYHVGSVWTHDTAMIIEGMLARGFTDQAQTLARGLLRASEGFDASLPELFGGQDVEQLFPPAPYPASCHPQAWAAASAFMIARALGGL